MLHKDLARQVSGNGRLEFGPADATWGSCFRFMADMQSPIKLSLYHTGAGGKN